MAQKKGAPQKKEKSGKPKKAIEAIETEVLRKIWAPCCSVFPTTTASEFDSRKKGKGTTSAVAHGKKNKAVAPYSPVPSRGGE